MQIRVMDIQKTRKALGLTQSQLGEQLGIHGSMVSKMESGHMIVGLRTILALEALATKAKIKL
jgi:transcriptional regulator with XRE-family HTH domain